MRPALTTAHSSLLSSFAQHFISSALNALCSCSFFAAHGQKFSYFVCRSSLSLCRFTCAFQRVTQLFCITRTLIYVKLAPAARRADLVEDEKYTCMKTPPLLKQADKYADFEITILCASINIQASRLCRAPSVDFRTAVRGFFPFVASL